MAFVKITKSGKRPMRIPTSSLPKYEACGWIASGLKKQKEQPVDAVEEKDEWEEADEELDNEKSVDEMSMEELQDKAKELGINTKNLNTVGALKKAIKRALTNE